MTDRTPEEIRALIRGAKRAERTVPVPMRGDLAAEVAELEGRLIQRERLQDNGADSLAGDPEAHDIAQRIEALQEEMQASVVTFRLRAMARREWTALIAQHPPREDNPGDKVMGIDVDGFMEIAVRRCVVAPDLDDSLWTHLLTEVLSDATWNLLVNTCWAVNQRDISVPFSRAASRILGRSATE